MGNSAINARPLVSILVPSYNHEIYVVECLDSIRDLDYERLELLVSDDCSPDKTFQVASKWAETNASRFERCVVQKTASNIGLVRNLSGLCAEAHGKYIAYIASDDFFLPTAVRFRVEMLEQDDSIDAVFGNARMVSATGEVLKEKYMPTWVERELLSPKLLLASLLLNWMVPGPSMLLRKTAVASDGSLGVLPVGLSAEDKYTYVRLAARGKLRYVAQCVAGYRYVEDSMSRPVSVQTRYWRYSIDADTRNRPLLHGLCALIADIRIARCRIELGEDSKAFMGARRHGLRVAAALLKLLLFVAALFRMKQSRLAKPKA